MSQALIELDIGYHVIGVTDDSQRFAQAARWIANRCGLRSLTASISIVDDDTIHYLNRTRLDHDWPTDVISFVFENQAGVVDGELIASADTASRVCVEAGWSATDELLLYVVHGLLHLAGLDDVDAAQQREMRQMESDCLASLSVPGAKEHVARWYRISN